MSPVLKSILWKAAYGAVAALAAAFAGWVQVNPDIQSWSIVSLKFAVLTALAGAAKKFIASVLTDTPL